MRASGSFFILQSRRGGEADYHAIEIEPQWFPAARIAVAAIATSIVVILQAFRDISGCVHD